MSISYLYVAKKFRDALNPPKGINIVLTPTRLINDFCRKFYKYLRIKDTSFKLQSLYKDSLKVL